MEAIRSCHAAVLACLLMSMFVSGCRLFVPSGSTQSSTPVASPSVADAVPTTQAVVNPLMAEFCPALAGETLASIYARSVELQRINGVDSGVVVDGGARVLKTLTIDDCGQGRGRVTLRFTEDSGGGLSGSELFIKEESTNSIVGLAVSAAGTELTVVPQELAFDKNDSKTAGSSKLVSTRNGCFECHSTVSYDYSMPGAAAFWDNAKLVAGLTPTDLPDGPTPAVDPGRADDPNFADPSAPQVLPKTEPELDTLLIPDPPL